MPEGVWKKHASEKLLEFLLTRQHPIQIVRVISRGRETIQGYIASNCMHSVPDAQFGTLKSQHTSVVQMSYRDFGAIGPMYYGKCPHCEMLHIGLV